MTLDPGLVTRFRRQLATGQVVLFTGAGFSYDAIGRDGQQVPTVDVLKRELWRLAFPSSAYEKDSSVGDLFDVATSRALGTVRDIFQERFHASAILTPERFNTWFSMPWKRHYTLNIDDVDEMVNSRVSLSRPIRSISASSRTAVQSQDLLSVHLNGRISDFPQVTFSVRQYGQRAGMPDLWYELLTSDLLSSPCLFVGTVLEEPGLWQHIEMRRGRQAGEVELRPPSYVVSPSLPQARAALLKNFNVDWIQATEEEFFDLVIAKSQGEAAQGEIAIKRLNHPSTGSSSLVTIDSLSSAPDETELRLFLRGREPVWADVTSKGYAVVRPFEVKLAESLRKNPRGIFVLTGTAASGKSTTAMRIALSFDAAGQKVHVFDSRRGALSANVVIRDARKLKSQVVLIDDVDQFGEYAGVLLRDLLSVSTVETVIATVRNSRLQSMGLEDALAESEWLEHNIPLLGDPDIDLLLDSLDRAGSLGRMTGIPKSGRRQILRDQAGRQLLVAMYYATSGEQLEDRVRSECEDLSGASRLAYGMAAWATSEHQLVTRQELLIGLGALGFGSSGNAVLNELDNLIKRQLLVQDSGSLRIRHRWIAEESLKFFSTNGLMKQVVHALAFAFATAADPQVSSHSRERRLLRRIINHDRLQRLVQSVDECREIYSALQDRLGWDFHYWLQRGSLEVEQGDLSNAKNYLESARSLVDGRNALVENEFAYLMLKRASLTPSSLNSVREAEQAFTDLEETMRDRGPTSPYAYHIYGSQGLRWARRAEIGDADRRLLVGRLLEAVREGRKHHSKRQDLKQLENDLEREYLLLATTQS